MEKVISKLAQIYGRQQDKLFQILTDMLKARKFNIFWYWETCLIVFSRQRILKVNLINIFVEIDFDMSFWLSGYFILKQMLEACPTLQDFH